MGKRIHRPKRGSLAYLPKGRAKSIICKIKYWPRFTSEKPQILGFSGYKVGMKHVYYIDDYPTSSTFSQEVFAPVTFLEVPPMIFCGIRAYSMTINGKKCLTEIWAKSLPKGINIPIKLAENYDTKIKIESIRKILGQISEFRAILCTQPGLTQTSKKKTEILEIKVDGGKIEDQLNYLYENLGKNINFNDVFKEGQLVDVISVTKGKGFQGPVKRWGVKKLHHKTRKRVRGVGSLGPWTPHYVMYSVPRAGQMGFHRRTEFNKRIMKIEKVTESFSPNGGFSHYGVIRNNYVIIEGSLPGSIKRNITIRYAVRPSKRVSEGAPKLTQLSTIQI